MSVVQLLDKKKLKLYNCPVIMNKAQLVQVQVFFS